MPLTDLITPAITELGKIKIGAKDSKVRGSGDRTWRAPVKLDHFVITTLRRDQAGDLIPDEALMASLSQYADPDGRLRQLPVAVLSNDPESVMQARWVAYQGKRVAAWSDGQVLTVHYDSQSAQWLPQPRYRDWDPEFAGKRDEKGNPLFKLHTVLNVVVAAQSARYGGVYKFRTTSRITASQLLGSILQLRQLTGGVLRGLPLTLVVRPVEVSPQGKPTTVYVVHLEMRGPDLAALQGQARDLMRFEIENAQQMRRAEQEYKRLLAPPGAEGDEAEAYAAEEFHPPALPAPQHQRQAQVPPLALQQPAQPRPDPLAARLAGQQPASAQQLQPQQPAGEDDPQPCVPPGEGDDEGAPPAGHLEDPESGSDD